MCMLTYLPPNALPDIEAIRNGTLYNRDGHGYAIVVPGPKPRLIVRKSLDSEELLAQFEVDRALYPSGPALFHSRFATSGSEDLFNVHPFRVENDSRTVVAHNGILPSNMLPTKDDPRCDTHLQADTSFATDYGHLSTPEARELLGKAIGSYNKLVFLSIDPALPSAFIINEESGQWDEGTWYSNGDYLGRKFYTTTSTTSYTGVGAFWDLDGADSFEETDCHMCHSFNSVDPELFICNMCNSCMDCYEDITECLCYWAPSAHYPSLPAGPSPIDDEDDYSPQSATELYAQAIQDKYSAAWEAFNPSNTTITKRKDLP